ncbi:MAG: metal-dependent hydrolase [Methanomicrobiales archaeon]|nr:metal-dependent hydrolase [Methanomicrobiales archaeon]
MDSITHGISAWILSILLGIPELAPFFVIGSVVPDADVLFGGLSDHDPRLYILSHGGFTHSLVGAASVTILAGCAISVIAFVAPVHIVPPHPSMPLVLLSLLVGAMLHISLDLLAYPGIPLLYPYTDAKYTLGIFPGPSMVIMVFSLFYAVSSFIRSAWSEYLGYYLLTTILFILLSAGLKAMILVRENGISIPTFNPFRWLNIQDTGDRYLVRVLSLPGGENGTWVYEKWRGITRHEVEMFGKVPEVARHRYFSYISVVSREGDRIEFSDPIRQNGLIFYPTGYRHLAFEWSGGRLVPAPSDPHSGI